MWGGSGAWLRLRLNEFERVLSDGHLALSRMQEVTDQLLRVIDEGAPITDAIRRIVPGRDDILTALPAVIASASLVRGETYLLAREQGSSLRELERVAGLSRTTILGLARRALLARRVTTR